jgi:large subunit ribosomal protein L13
VECGDFVVVTNAEKIKLTGRKRESMSYDWYTYYPGGHKQVSLVDMQRKHPGRIIEHAVRRMLPKSAQGRRILRNLKVFAGPKHPHQAQQCKPLELDKI